MLAIPGIFRITDTSGLPLEVILLECRDRGVVVAWDEFIDDARNHGWSDKTIYRKAASAVAEAFDPEYQNEFIKRLNLYMGGP